MYPLISCALIFLMYINNSMEIWKLGYTYADVTHELLI